MSFQNGFQAGFQGIVYLDNFAPNGNNGRKQEYTPTSHELTRIERLNKIEQLKLKSNVVTEDLKAQEIRIEELELKRLREGLADKKLQAELLRLMAQRYEMALMQLELMRLIEEMLLEEEALLVILLSSTF